MNRREFLIASALGAAGTVAAAGAPVAKPVVTAEAKQTATLALVRTEPVLQAPAETSMGVVWAVHADATGAVEYADNPEMKHCKTDWFGMTGERGVDAMVLSVRLTGLKPDTRYWYRTVTRAVVKGTPSGEPQRSRIYSFVTLGKKHASEFAVINDTHEHAAAVREVFDKVKQLDPSVLVWNGDMLSWISYRTQAVSALLSPEGRAYGTDMPLLYVPGNHDYRGKWTINRTGIMMPRPKGEHPGEFERLTRNFAVRVGDVAMIGMDTGEDKPDRHPAWHGLACFEPYRELQTRWLAQALERPEIKEAPFIVLFCHIPLFDPRPDANPGDLLTGYADWQRPASDMWSPLLKKYGVQLVVAAHTHYMRVDPPTSDRPWAQWVGGGPLMENPVEEPTVIHGAVVNGKLKMTMYAMIKKKIVAQSEIEPRKV